MLLLKDFNNNKMYFCVVLCCSLKHISIYYSPLCPIKFKSSGSGWVERLFPGGLGWSSCNVVKSLYICPFSYLTKAFIIKLGQKYLSWK